jgi:hypothetical protein
MRYLYGVVPVGQQAPDRTGVGSPPQPVRVLEGNTVAALVSDLPDGYEVHEQDARQHLQVLIAALRDGPVVPLRMGTVAADDAQAREVLAAAEAHLARNLEKLADLVELQVDADDEMDDVVALVTGGAPPLDLTGADLATRIEVGQRIAALVTDHRREVAASVVDRLRRLSVDDVPRAQLGGPEDPVLRWAFLVKRDDVELFDDAVASLRAEFPSLTFRYVGPLPAAHFVDREPVPATEPADSFRGDGSWGW